MTVPTIYGVLNSRASRAIWLAEEMGIAYRHVAVIQASRLPDPGAPDAPLNTSSDAFRAICSHGRIPVLEDDGLIVSESLAILMHLVMTRGGTMAPRDARETARLLEVGFWAATELEPDAVQIIVNRAVREPADRDEAVCRAAENRLAAALRRLEGMLIDDWLIGGRFTVADLLLAEVLRYAGHGRGLFDGMPRTSAWLARCRARPAARRVDGWRHAEPLPEGWRRAYRREAAAVR